jgi:hypothetical protein
MEEELLKITNLNGALYLDEAVLGELRESLKELLSYIKNSGQLEKYWSKVDMRND